MIIMTREYFIKWILIGHGSVYMIFKIRPKLLKWAWWAQTFRKRSRNDGERRSRSSGIVTTIIPSLTLHCVMYSITKLLAKFLPVGRRHANIVVQRQRRARSSLEISGNGRLIMDRQWMDNKLCSWFCARPYHILRFHFHHWVRHSCDFEAWFYYVQPWTSPWAIHPSVHPSSSWVIPGAGSGTKCFWLIILILIWKYCVDGPPHPIPNKSRLPAITGPSIYLGDFFMRPHLELLFRLIWCLRAREEASPY